LFVVLVARNRAVSLSWVSEPAITARADGAHDVLGMPVHHSVLEVEPLQVRDRGRLDLFREAKVAAELGDLGHVQLDEQMLFV
jgi:hypothetical protein